MARSPFQSDFVFHSEEPPPPAEASRGATRIVMTLTFIVIAALVLLCMVGPHIPSGE